MAHETLHNTWPLPTSLTTPWHIPLLPTGSSIPQHSKLSCSLALPLLLALPGKLCPRSLSFTRLRLMLRLKHGLLREAFPNHPVLRPPFPTWHISFVRMSR